MIVNFSMQGFISKAKDLRVRVHQFFLAPLRANDEAGAEYIVFYWKKFNNELCPHYALHIKVSG